MNARPIPSVKSELRREMTARRDALPAAERERIAAALVERIVALPRYASARSVLATMAIGSEWNTRLFLDRAHADGKGIVLPRITPPPRHLELHLVRDLDHDLVPGIWNIPEPDPARCPRVEIAEVDFAVVPALAADLDGYRLGYGAGYFDRLLSGRTASTYCVAGLPSAFVVESLPHEAHDQPLDLVVDELGTRRTRDAKS
ncbi:MAG TPA: 5-formyltetrahydrofolate cyclo-ligase [Usitatibacter sp.]|nr:5-formyltetrahydrofolate cyclo-ligase [Usitatibacter sp.]